MTEFVHDNITNIGVSLFNIVLISWDVRSHVCLEGLGILILYNMRINVAVYWKI